MAMQTRILQSFTGIRQDRNDYISSPDTSPDACNMNTQGGCLSVATGFSRAVPYAVPHEHPLKGLFVCPTRDGLRFLAATDEHILLYLEQTDEWGYLFSAIPNDAAEQVCFLPVRIGSDDALVMARGQEQMLCWDGASTYADWFGDSTRLSDHTEAYAALYFGRLFAAGNPEAPSRLYWSKAPGDGRTIEDWRSDDASPDVSGGFVDIGTASDPITGLYALSNQLLIFKHDSLYRLLGDRPSNYRVLPVDAAFSRPGRISCARYADRLYFLTESGLCFFDGQTVRRPQSHRALCRLLSYSDLDHCVAAAVGDMLYFAIREDTDHPYNDVLIEYDAVRDTFMLRRGFSIAGLCAARGKLYLLTGDGWIEVFDGSPDYDGIPIRAWWETPRFDLGNKQIKKALSELTCTGEGATMLVTALFEGNMSHARVEFPLNTDCVAEAILRGEGRVFRIRFANEPGGLFTLDSGVALRFDTQMRPE